MDNYFKVEKKIISRMTSDGAGVKLKRVFGNEDPLFSDPFLLLDDFASEDPEDYIAGFPWHPHRGIITVSYMLEGQIRHEDSLGNNGVIGPGDTQWMKAGSGIIHQEMPEQKEGVLRGLQLWINLPSSEKMTPPLYQDIDASLIPEINRNGVHIRIITGSLENQKGPVENIPGDPFYLDISLEKRKEFFHEIPKAYRTILYVLEGEISVGNREAVKGEALFLVIDREKNGILKIESQGSRFLLVGGKPFNEPIAWHGPIVMNTREELVTAFKEYEEGTFIKK